MQARVLFALLAVPLHWWFMKFPSPRVPMHQDLKKHRCSAGLYTRLFDILVHRALGLAPVQTWGTKHNQMIVGPILATTLGHARLWTPGFQSAGEQESGLEKLGYHS